jgi:hypothetical protein
MLKLAAEGGGPKGAMQRMVAQNKEKYAAALAEFDDLDSPEATKVRQRLFREDWQKQMALDAAARAGGAGGAPSPPGGSGSSTTFDITKQIEQMQQQNADVFAIPDYFVYMSRYQRRHVRNAMNDPTSACQLLCARAPNVLCV